MLFSLWFHAKNHQKGVTARKREFTLNPSRKGYRKTTCGFLKAEFRCEVSGTTKCQGATCTTQAKSASGYSQRAGLRYHSVGGMVIIFQLHGWTTHVTSYKGQGFVVRLSGCDNRPPQIMRLSMSLKSMVVAVDAPVALLVLGLWWGCGCTVVKVGS